VRKWLKAPVLGEPKYRRGVQPGKLTAFHEAVQQALKADGHRPKRERRTARALYAELKAAGYAGGYTRLVDAERLPCPVLAAALFIDGKYQAFVARTGADELMITSQIFDHTARMTAYEITARRPSRNETPELPRPEIRR
jgi:hypothetical protein